VANGFFTRGMLRELQAYRTETLEYSFYFPAPGTFEHYPVHVARGERVVAWAKARALEVVDTGPAEDHTSWAWISQRAKPEAVLEALSALNLESVELSRIAWRVRDHKFFSEALRRLRARRVYDDTLWSYAVHHRDTEALAEYLEHQESLLSSAGALHAGVLRIDPVERGWYEHREFAPLVNARAHALGSGGKRILNDAFRQRYEAYMRLLARRPAPTGDELLQVALYLFLQDRVEKALEVFDRIDGEKITTRLQYDYLSIYQLLYREQSAGARAIAERYRDYPVDRWRKLFRSALAQLDEAEGAEVRVEDDEAREQRHDALADQSPSLSLVLEGGAPRVHAKNLDTVTVRLYPMDVELLFSRQPFAEASQRAFSYVAPSHEESVAVPESGAASYALPEAYKGRNVVVEVRGEDQRDHTALFQNELSVSITERYGLVKVRDRASGAPLSKVYVKCYARTSGGEVRFYKDGYTDLRGAFDYASLSTNDLQTTERFAILVVSDDKGALIREAAPPAR
jgi:tetratricopeptide (TPR) repeat protein